MTLLSRRPSAVLVAVFALVALFATAPNALAQGKGRVKHAPSSILGAWRLISMQNGRPDGTLNATREGLDFRYVFEKAFEGLVIDRMGRQ